MKRISLLVVSSLFALRALAWGDWVDGVLWYYTIVDNEGSYIQTDPQWNGGHYEGDLTTPAELGGASAVGIDEWAFFDCTKLTSLTVSEGVVDIGENAFSDCTSLTTMALPRSLESIGTNAFEGCAVEKFLVGRGETARLSTLVGGTGLSLVGIQFEEPEDPMIDVALWSERESDTNGCEVSGAGVYKAGQTVTLKVTVPKGTKERATAFLGWYRVDGNEATPWPNAVDSMKTSVKYTMTEESLSLFAKVAAETTDDVAVDCAGLRAYGGQITAGVAGGATGVPLDIKTVGDVPPKSVKVANLPSGMKYDAKTGRIIGAPTKAGESKQVTITVTTANGVGKTSEPIPLTVVALPSLASGTFDGFVLNGESDNCGTLNLSVKENGKLSAKVATADGSYSFAGACWDAVTDGVYHVTMKAKNETLALRLDSAAAWNENQLGGTLTAAGVVREVTAQRNAFGQPWCFCASGDEENGWDLAYTNVTKGASLTVTFKLDGTTAIAGSLTGKQATYKVSAKGSANVSMMTNGAFAADFAPVVKVGSEKKVLSIRTNLWMDRDNRHVDDGFGVGDAKLVR